MLHKSWIVVVTAFGYAQAQLSGTCSSETSMIYTDAFIDDFVVNCMEKELFYCEVDTRTDDVPGLITYRDRCFELDGQMFWSDELQECTSDFTEIPYRNLWLNLPTCLGKSCTLDDFIQLQIRNLNHACCFFYKFTIDDAFRV